MFMPCALAFRSDRGNVLGSCYCQFIVRKRIYILLSLLTYLMYGLGGFVCRTVVVYFDVIPWVAASERLT